MSAICTRDHGDLAVPATHTVTVHQAPDRRRRVSTLRVCTLHRDELLAARRGGAWSEPNLITFRPIAATVAAVA